MKEYVVVDKLDNKVVDIFSTKAEALQLILMVEGYHEFYLVTFE